MSEQPELFFAARNTDPETSQVNRDAFVKKASQRDLILRTYARQFETAFGNNDRGLTDEEAGMKTPWLTSTMFEHRVCYWKRCSELRKLGFIAPIGETRQSRAGQQQQVCKLTSDGYTYVHAVFGFYE